MKEPWERGEEDEKDGLGLCSEMECCERSDRLSMTRQTSNKMFSNFSFFFWFPTHDNDWWSLVTGWSTNTWTNGCELVCEFSVSFYIFHGSS